MGRGNIVYIELTALDLNAHTLGQNTAETVETNIYFQGDSA